VSQYTDMTCKGVSSHRFWGDRKLSDADSPRDIVRDDQPNLPKGDPRDTADDLAGLHTVHNVQQLVRWHQPNHPKGGHINALYDVCDLKTAQAVHQASHVACPTNMPALNSPTITELTLEMLKTMSLAYTQSTLFTSLARSPKMTQEVMQITWPVCTQLTVCTAC